MLMIVTVALVRSGPENGVVGFNPYPGLLLR